MNYIWFDVAIGSILFFFVWRGCRRGFVLTLSSLLTLVVAFVGAAVLSAALAEPTAKLIEPVIVSSIQDQVSSYWQHAPEAGATSQDVAAWLAQLPLGQVLEPLLESKFFQGFAETFQQAVNEEAANAAAHTAQALAHFVAVHIARSVIFMITFVLLIFAWDAFSRTLDLVTKLPVIHSANQLTGGAIGLVKGALIVFIAVWLLRDSYIPPAAVEQTWLLKLFATVNPLSFFL